MKLICGIALSIAAITFSGCLMAGVFERHDGRSFFLGLGAWGLLRALVSMTWRDSTVALGLNAGGLVAIAVVVVSTVGFIWLVSLGPRMQDRARRAAEVSLADPEIRPGI